MTTFSVLTPITPTLDPGPNATLGVAPLDPAELVFTSAAANQVVPLSDTLMTLVFIKNTSTTQTVTFTNYQTVGGSDKTVTAASGTTLTGVWLPYHWGNRDNTSGAYGGCELTWHAEASLTNMSIAVVQVPYASI